MKKSRIFLTTLIIDLLRFVLKLAFWLLLLKGLIVWQSHLSTIHYQRGDVLDERFRVLAVMEQGKIYPVKLTQFDYKSEKMSCYVSSIKETDDLLRDIVEILKKTRTKLLAGVFFRPWTQTHRHGRCPYADTRWRHLSKF